MADTTDELTLTLDRTDGGYRPGEVITGLMRWSLDEPPELIDVRLFWWTSGKGTSDSGLMGELKFEGLAASGEQAIVFDVPSGPYSFSGKLVTIQWAVEAIARPGKRVARAALVLSATGTEVAV
ncbi:MAG: hypothetical protein ACIAXF_09370 [Phycisphaerales bacterium JB063]